MLNIQKKLIKFNHSVGNNIEYIVIHDTGNPGNGANALAHFNFFNGGDRQSSAHYFVDDSNIIQLVEDRNASWHCGDGQDIFGIGNHNSLSVEICINPESDYFKTIINVIELVVFLMHKYNININNVVRHYDASHKNCPGTMNRDGSWSGWTAFKNQLREYLKLPNLQPAKKIIPYPKRLIKFNDNYDALAVMIQVKLGIKGDGFFGTKTEAAVIAFQEKNGLVVDGEVGINTWNKLFN